MLPKTYRPDEVESRLYARWEESGAFACGRRPAAEPFCMVIPPPNVTGNLHMGHALNNTLQDVLVRFQRMRGRDCLWQPGTDHAGIATQMVVERQLEAEGKSRIRLGRAAFLDRVWRWKAESGGAITRQLRRLGASCDWSRERFTMDQGLSQAVRKVFVELHRAGLIYRDKRLVNWDPKLHTAISDLEVEAREVKGHLWHIRYPIDGMPDSFIVVATTRPETMLGDTAVAVHPDDERYRHLIGRFVELPLVARKIPIVADSHADPEQGSGAVKITPAHDFDDFEVGRRHNLPQINIFDIDARLNGAVPERYQGLDRYVAREKVIADLEAASLLAKTEDHVHKVPYGDRSGVVIEPWLTDQWYVDAARLAAAAIAAIERGETRFVPQQWEKTYFEWMRNIQPWCISRQLWWGHRIPAWYAPDGKIFVAESEEEALAEAESDYGTRVALEQDPDVLDTWFSSALWPFSTLGWPDQTVELKRYYPTAVLVTGFDIIFFWVARMMMMGLQFMGEVPFRTVYIHALVRDEKGQKMSKSKGNVLDPLVLVDSFGADALRFTLAAMAAPGRDVKLSESRVEGYRNFATKLWNAARFAEMNECRPRADFHPGNCTEVVNRWILGALSDTSRSVTAMLDSFRFDEAAGQIYHFVWNVFCDWYLEFIKPLLSGEHRNARDETQAACAFVLEKILHLLHPFMPFVTEELWQRLDERGDALLMLASWPGDESIPADHAAMAEMDWVVGLISALRTARAEINVPAAAKVELRVLDANAENQRRLDRHVEAVRRLARVETIVAGGIVPEDAMQIVHDEATLVVPLQGVIDLEQERARLLREKEKVAVNHSRLAAKLERGDFVAKAPAEVVEENRERLAEAAAVLAKLDLALRRLAGGSVR
jgi:valyl-tRNA synthetase